jgi:hypothetical protein
MRNALLFCAVLGIAGVLAGAASAHEYVPYRHHHRYHPRIVVAPRPVVVARRVPPVVVVPGTVLAYPPYAPIVAPAPVCAPPPRAAFGYYGRGFGITLGF